MVPSCCDKRLCCIRSLLSESAPILPYFLQVYSQDRTASTVVILVVHSKSCHLTLALLCIGAHPVGTRSNGYVAEPERARLLEVTAQHSTAG